MSYKKIYDVPPDAPIHAKRIAKRLNALKWTQDDLAKKSKVSTGTISSLIYGKKTKNKSAEYRLYTEPRINTTKDVATALGVSTDYLLGLTDQPTNDKDLASAADYLGISDTTAESMRTGKSYLENAIMNSFIDAFTDILPQIANEVNEMIKRHFYEKHIILFVAQLHGIAVPPEEIEDEGIDAIKHKLGRNSPEWVAFKKSCDKRIQDFVKEGIFATSADIDYHKYLTKNMLDQIFDNVCKELMTNEVFKRYDVFYKQLLDWFQNNTNTESDKNIYKWIPFMIQCKLEERVKEQTTPNKWQLSGDFLNGFDSMCEQIFGEQPKKAGE